MSDSWAERPSLLSVPTARNRTCPFMFYPWCPARRLLLQGFTCPKCSQSQSVYFQDAKGKIHVSSLLCCVFMTTTGDRWGWGKEKPKISRKSHGKSGFELGPPPPPSLNVTGKLDCSIRRLVDLVNLHSHFCESQHELSIIGNSP